MRMRDMLNSNIRCIEIYIDGKLIGAETRLNSNIRCIEIDNRIIKVEESVKLNSNIRCIEISVSANYATKSSR